MRYPLAASAARLGAALCLTMVAATGASGQVTDCWMSPSQGTPVVNRAHILCGEVRQDPNTLEYYASGFHSRENGVNPVRTTPSGRTIRIISNDHTIRHPAVGMPDIYQIRYFIITEGPQTKTKRLSTMFPDHCSPTQVLMAIRHAVGNQNLPANATVMGQSGTSCLANGNQFDIIAHTDGAGAVDSAYPNYN